jgi:uncharacterized protein YdeI (YjbR/CyaY-like superfamily)
MQPTFFASPATFRTWLEENHDRASELLVGFYKRGSGRPSMTWPESVDQALSFGWIDGVRKRIDDVSYTIRFTPRKPVSTWSTVNIRRVEELKKLGLMQPAGLRAFERRRDEKSSIYSYENAPRTLDPADEKRFRAAKQAWKFFNDQAPSYRRVAIYWIMSAKKAETRARRLALLIDDSAQGKRLDAYTLKPKKHQPSTD